MKNNFISILGLLALYSCREKEQKPNIILILADDMGYECIGANGCAEYATPNIDALANNGVRFTNCYSTPLSTPSRVSLMTGKYNYRNYKDFGYLDLKEKTFANILKDAGYKTFIAGKWQLNGIKYPEKYPEWNSTTTPHHFGFDGYCLWQLTKAKGKNGERYADPHIIVNSQKYNNKPDDYGPDVFCRHILSFIRENADKPFLVYYPMVLVHDPFVPTPDSEEWSDSTLRYSKDTAFFKDMMHYADKIVGRIVQELERLGIAENTIVIFIGDNGTGNKIYTNMKNGEVIRGGKSLLTNGGTHVPLIVFQKNHYSPKVCDALIDFPDILPTLCDMAGVAMPDDFITDGHSFLNVLIGEEYKESPYVFMHYYPKWLNQPSGQFIRDKQYKLYRNGTFYDLEKDPLEKDSLQLLSLNTEQKKVYDYLSKEIEKFPRVNE